MNGEYRKIEEELREFCGGNQIIIPGQEEKYLRRGRMRVLRVEKKKKAGTRETMGGIGRLKRIIRAIFSGEEPKQDN